MTYALAFTVCVAAAAVLRPTIAIAFDFHKVVLWNIKFRWNISQLHFNIIFAHSAKIETGLDENLDLTGFRAVELYPL